eukprot:gene24440-65018_t
MASLPHADWAALLLAAPALAPPTQFGRAGPASNPLAPLAEVASSSAALRRAGVAPAAGVRRWAAWLAAAEEEG